jgi:hypothetical protein
MTDRETNTLAARGLEELRVNLLLKENSFVSNIIPHRSSILELKFYKLHGLICIMFSSLVTLATRGLEEHFSSCAVVSFFWLWRR